jgi:GT2 family glycosyltransferase
LRARDDGDALLFQDTTKAAAAEPDAAHLHYALGHALVIDRRHNEKLRPATAWEAARDFQRALQLDPRHLLAAFSLVEVLATDPEGHAQSATIGATQVLAMLDHGVGRNAESLAAPPFVGDMGLLALEWDRAGLESAGRPDAEVAAKVRLLRWRLHTLLGRLHPNDPSHHGRALEQRPDLPTTHAAYGTALLRAQRASDGIQHLLRELHTNPFDAEAARILFRALSETGQRDAADRLASTRRLLCSIASDRTQLELWFSGPSGVPAPRQQSIAPATQGRMRVSLCLIVKNEESNIAACLQSAAGLCDEVIAVDTGSTDRTREIATELGARVFEFAWVDSFSAARNECLKHATGDWIFWLDADDRIDDDNRRKLKDLFASLPDANLCFSMKCRCLPDPATGVYTDVDHIRLFRRHPAIRWTFRVHEQILPSVRAAGGEVRWSDAVILHTGYTDPALRRRKLERDLRLLRLEESEQPEGPFTLFNLGSVTQELGRPEEALTYLRKSLAGSHPNDSIVRKLYALIVGCHRALKQTAEAVAACAEGLRVCPNDTELLYLEAVLRRDQHDLAGAEACLLRLVHERPGTHFASVDPGMRSYKARHLLGVVYFEQGRLAEAQALWHLALSERSDFLPAWLGLGECALRGSGAVEEVARALEALPGGQAEAEALRARALSHRPAHVPPLPVVQPQSDNTSPAYGRTSIIVVTHNQLRFTCECLASIQENTGEPYELIVVDNGSTDGTLPYLQSLPNVQLIANAHNRGFPAAVNQGLRIAAGEQVLLLNNDCVVPAGWLGRLLRVLAGDDRVGLVGPCSNYVSGPQQVPVTYRDLAGPDVFAAEHARANDRQWVDTQRLVAFCLLVRRAVVDKVGPLDEQFGIGCYEDDDYCLRALRAGFRVVLARDAFVHHYGGRTFVGSGIDFAALMRSNSERFQRKWSGPAA